MPDRHLARSLCAIALHGIVSLARADEIPRSDSPARPAVDIDVATGPRLKLDGLIGLSVTSAAEYPGSGRRDLSVRPLGAIRYRRLRIATSGSGSLLDFGADADVSGVSLELVQSTRWKLRTGLRVSGGRDSAESRELSGIPDVRKTVLARASATYVLTSRWSLGSTLSADLLGRGTGVFVTSGVDYRYRIASRTELQLGAGFTVANATHLDSYYGVPVAAQTDRRPAYSPGAGLKDAGIGITLTTVIGPQAEPQIGSQTGSQWVLFGGLRYTRLLGDAASSPLARRSSDVQATAGIAWRCCR